MPKAMLAKLPEKARDIYEGAWDQAKASGADDETAAKAAIGAVKRAGYARGDDGQWAKMEAVEWHITKATLTKDGIMRWAATVSKFDPDKQGDQLTPEFLAYAKQQIGGGRRPDPVVCVSHIDQGRPSDAWCAGDCLELYVDGNRPKAKGTFRDTPLGRASFDAIRRDYETKRPKDQRVRISLGFFDEGSLATKATLPDGTEVRGRKFYKGWIKHLALTRVPVVGETEIEASLEAKSMSGKPKTKREDAATIVGDELANELAGLAAKSDVEDAEMIRKDENPQAAKDIAQAEGKRGVTEEVGDVDETEEETGKKKPEEVGDRTPEELAQRKADIEANPAAQRRDQVYTLLNGLASLLLPDEDAASDYFQTNRAALGQQGSNPPSTVQQSEPAAAPGQDYQAQGQAGGEVFDFADASGDPDHVVEVAGFVDDWAFRVKSALLSEGDRTAKLEMIQRALYDFGEGVQILVKDTTPTSGRDMSDVIAEAIRQAVEPLYNEMQGMKADVASVMQFTTGMQSGIQQQPASMPQAMDQRARVMQQENQMPYGIGTGRSDKAQSASQLAWQSTQTQLGR